jgi:hypothetical protein
VTILRCVSEEAPRAEGARALAGGLAAAERDWAAAVAASQPLHASPVRIVLEGEARIARSATAGGPRGSAATGGEASCDDPSAAALDEPSAVEDDAAASPALAPCAEAWIAVEAALDDGRTHVADAVREGGDAGGAAADPRAPRARLAFRLPTTKRAQTNFKSAWVDRVFPALRRAVRRAVAASGAGAPCIVVSLASAEAAGVAAIVAAAAHLELQLLSQATSSTSPRALDKAEVRSALALAQTPCGAASVDRAFIKELNRWFVGHDGAAAEA